MTVQSLELHPEWMRVPLDGGDHADFHHRWLRHNCNLERHPQTRERTRCSSELPDDITARRAEIVGDILEIDWSDEHSSQYPLEWLRENAYALNRVAVPPPSNDLERMQVHAKGLTVAEQIAAALDRIHKYGAAVVRRDPDDATSPEDATDPLIDAFEAAGLSLIPTHFGRIEDLRPDNNTNKHTDQLGYTYAGIGLHTDQPFLENPPRYQLLQGIRTAQEGGVNLLADARSAYRYLESIDAHSADVLATVPVKISRKQKEWSREFVTPLIAARDDANFHVRSSYFTYAPHAMDFDKTLDFYRAHDKFIRLLRDPKYHVQALLQPGDWLIYDNHRCLHARTSFSGSRWLRGIYFDDTARPQREAVMARVF
jgi:gamma-butyrobetaine dioxygenase/trimethyllysine dioxygenase